MTIGFLLLAILVVLLNWIALLVSVRNKRRGIDRHVSPIPIAAQVFGVVGAIISYFNPAEPIRPWAYILVALLDVPLWSLAYLPIYWLKRRRNPD
jgi:hypothetical protein